MSEGRSKFNPIDKQVCFIFRVGSLVIITAAALIVKAQYPVTILIQETKYYITPLSPKPTLIQAEVTFATYDVPQNPFISKSKMLGISARSVERIFDSECPILESRYPLGIYRIHPFLKFNVRPMIVNPSETINPGERPKR
ncbi:hypothetical protein A7Q09_05945 [Methylacidiphilum sp. Yel]|uniref:methane monooxygenase/ammonia monooxygenase subunit B n=1 Tax=Methylacidiphilum sp. Yel TaxID=1847730 RepID=UPI001103A9B1|nr:methane monooxygenase/ammonia monooxygenase subunit B [Methylacidiphilum sp. Yel]TFE69144.1 hypothetical protein A7Q09_05945 [Methylacidiphilum sp. Yel]